MERSWFLSRSDDEAFYSIMEEGRYYNAINFVFYWTF